jgi:nucleoside-diphosphate-sugar epimerase
MISIEQLANLVRKEAIQLGLPKNSIKVMQTPNPDKSPEAYVPLVERAKKELGLTCTVNLSDSIQRIIRHHLELAKS